MAGVQAGLINDLEDLRSLRGNQADVFEPSLDSKQRQEWLKQWSDAISRSLRWHE
ncbi:MAG: Uncharacterised protein [Cyanobium sp. ARS6]|nr:MAG: Uncharacterised protein [Cyanobium sp. ARS6]